MGSIANNPPAVGAVDAQLTKVFEELKTMLSKVNNEVSSDLCAKTRHKA